MELIFKHKKVEAYMTPEVRTLDRKESVYKAIDVMNHYNMSCIVVTRHDKAVGIITERDIMRRVALGGKNLRKTKLKEVMSSPLISKPSDTRINEIISLMSRYSIRRMVIMDGDELKGIITQTDIVRMSNKYIEVLDIIKLYFYLLAGVGLIAGAYLLLKMFIK